MLKIIPLFPWCSYSLAPLVLLFPCSLGALIPLFPWCSYSLIPLGGKGVREQGSEESKGGKGVREQGSEESKSGKGVREQGS